MIPVTRTFGGDGRITGPHRYDHPAPGQHRPLSGGAPKITGPLPVAIPGMQPFAGMDPSNPATYVRPWNPQPGMIALLNYNGAATQSRQPTGGLQRGRQQRRQFR